MTAFVNSTGESIDHSVGRQRVSGPPELVIGDGSFVGHRCAFNIGAAIRIGKHCLLAGGVAVFDMDGHPADADAGGEESRRHPFSSPPS